jgi:hypothetical protein
MDPLLLPADSVTLQAADTAAGRKPRVEIVAYTGGLMRVPPWGQVAIELAGLAIGAQTPLLSDHKAERGGIVGYGQAKVGAGKLLVSGTITAATEAARETVELARDGFAFQASIGVQPLDFVRIRPGETAVVNGKPIQAPSTGFVHVRKGILKEVSFVAFGADSDTSVAIAASRRRQGNMDFHDWLRAKGFDPANLTDGQQATLRASYDAEQTSPADPPGGPAPGDLAEQRRIQAIRSRCGGEHPDIEARAIGEGWNLDRTGQAVDQAVQLAELRASRSGGPFIHTRGGNGATSAAALEAGALLLLGHEQTGEKLLGERAMEQGRAIRATCMLDLCKAALTLDRIDLPSGGRDSMIRAAFSSVSLPTALGNSAGKIAMDAYRESPATWRTFASIKNASSFREHNGIRLTELGQLEEVGEAGELKHGRLGESTYAFRLATYGKILGLSRQAIINDDLSLFSDMSASFGRQAARRLSDLVYSTLLANAGNFFHANNSNVLTGAGSALDIDSLNDGIVLMAKQRDADDNDLDIRPGALVVPPELRETAKAALESENIAHILPADSTGGSVQRYPSGNALKDVVKLETEPRLSNTDKFDSASTTGWYLFGSPQDAALIVAFLNGMEAPTIEFFGTDSEAETLGVRWRVYFDFGAALADPKAAVRAAGA